MLFLVILGTPFIVVLAEFLFRMLPDMAVSAIQLALILGMFVILLRVLCMLV
jgi:hypothetical protein